MASDLDRLDADLPTDGADVGALRRARDASRMTVAEIIEALRALGTLPPARLRERSGPRGEPFRL